MKIEVQELRPDDKLACDVCGRFGVIQLDNRKLCPACYAGSGAQVGRAVLCPPLVHTRLTARTE